MLDRNNARQTKQAAVCASLDRLAEACSFSPLASKSKVLCAVWNFNLLHAIANARWLRRQQLNLVPTCEIMETFRRC